MVSKEDWFSSQINQSMKILSREDARNLYVALHCLAHSKDISVSVPPQWKDTINKIQQENIGKELGALLNLSGLDVRENPLQAIPTEISTFPVLSVIISVDKAHLLPEEILSNVVFQNSDCILNLK